MICDGLQVKKVKYNLVNTVELRLNFFRAYRTKVLRSNEIYKTKFIIKESMVIMLKCYHKKHM